jgi:iron complex outermembrane recepter protein
VQLAATYRYRGAFLALEELARSSAFVNDLNSEQAAGFAITNLRVGATAIFGRRWLSPVVGVQNLFDKQYVGSIAINAQRGKYYEPAPGRVWFAGLTLATGK